MKKILLTVALALVGGSAFAQISLGGGYLNNNGKVVKTLADGSKTTESDKLQGFYVGASFDIPLGKGITISPGAYYYYLTRRDNASVGSGTLGGSSNFVRNDHGISVPVNVKYGFEAVPGVLSIGVFAGPAFQYTFSSKEKQDITVVVGGASSTSTQKYDNLQSGDLKPFDITIGGGVYADIVKMIRVSAGYNYGLLNRTGADNTTLHYSGFHAGVAFIF